MIKTGDKVKFLNDVGGGIVTGFIGANTVKVENEDGFEIPYPLGQLINISDPAFNSKAEAGEKDSFVEREEKEQQERKGRIIEGKDKPEFFFCFVPDDPVNPLADNIDLFLVNDSNYTVLYRYVHLNEGRCKTVKHGTVYPNSKVELENIGRNDLAGLPEYGFQLISFRDEEMEWIAPVSKKLKVNPVKFYKERSFEPNLFFDKNAMVFQISENILETEISKLTEDDFQKVVETKEKETSVQKHAKKVIPEITEVDLHIYELIDNTAGLTNKEILDIQLAKVETEMNAAVASGVRRIVFIHGVGQGILKQEISRLLKRQFPGYPFHDASFREYGFGATMVIIRNK
jgi:hypothetical protein